MSPKISVIVAIYNTEKYLKDCLYSITTQTYSNLEIILINDGSNDKSLEICNFFAIQDARIILIDQQNSGQAAARNVGLSIATGDYIAFVDSDDTISKDLFLENIKILEQDISIDFLQFPRYINFGSEESKLIKTRNEFMINQKNLYKSWLEDKIISWFIWDKIYKKDVFKTLRFQEGMVYEDNYLIADVLEISKNVFLSTEGVYYYWLRENSTTTSKHSLKKDLDTQKVSLHILNKIKSVDNLTYAKTTILSRIFYVYISILKNFNYNINTDDLFVNELKKIKLKEILKSSLPKKQILKLMIVKLIGVNNFLAIYKK
tara:strand:+ start:2358 stop:3311 length:954 start_codon:yes stop_codon:yes gene_type:complete